MKFWAENIIDTMENTITEKLFKGFKICKIKSIEPLILQYNNLEISTLFGDTIYIHPLFNKTNINLDKNIILNLQNFTSSTAYNSPEFQAKIEGGIVQFISDFYEFYKNNNAIYILSEGDSVAVYELEGNSFLILQKVIKEIIEQNNGDENNEL